MSSFTPPAFYLASNRNGRTSCTKSGLLVEVINPDDAVYPVVGKRRTTNDLRFALVSCTDRAAQIEGLKAAKVANPHGDQFYQEQIDNHELALLRKGNTHAFEVVSWQSRGDLARKALATAQSKSPQHITYIIATYPGVTSTVNA